MTKNKSLSISFTDEHKDGDRMPVPKIITPSGVDLIETLDVESAHVKFVNGGFAKVELDVYLRRLDVESESMPVFNFRVGDKLHRAVGLVLEDGSILNMSDIAPSIKRGE